MQPKQKANSIKNMKKINLTVSLFSLIALAGCQDTPEQTLKSEAIKVKVMQVTTGPNTPHRRFSGTVEAENGTVLSFPVMGTIQTINITLGQHVNKGELLATLDPVSIQSSYTAANASLEQAEDAYRRMKTLHDKGSLPEMQWVEVQSKLKQARSMKEIAEKNLKDCKLYAPFEGVIAEKSIEVGQNVTPGIPIAKLVTANQLKVKIAVPETEIANVALTQKAEITVPALKDKNFSGTVAEKGIVAHPLSRSYDVKIRIQNSGTGLMPGMVTEVLLNNNATQASEQCIIPAHIVQLDENNHSFVWIEKEGKASKRVINCGDFTANGVTVISGLQKGDRIIIEGQQKVCEGTSLVF